MNGRLFNIQRFCTDDGPGIRTTVFLKGCPLRCIWCHNPESQASEFELDYGYFSSVEDTFHEIMKDKVYYDASGGGVTLSGGEPLYQPEFTRALLKLCRENRIHTVIETSGFASEAVFSSVADLCDLVLFDIKETDEEKHLLCTGVPLEPILRNLKALHGMKIPHIIRAPIIPAINDRPTHFSALKALCVSSEYCERVEIMPYHRLGEEKYRLLGREYACLGTQEPSKTTVAEWYELLK